MNIEKSATGNHMTEDGQVEPSANMKDYGVCGKCGERNHVDMLVPVFYIGLSDVCIWCFKKMELVWNCGECMAEFVSTLPTHCPHCNSSKVWGEFVQYDSLIRDAQEVEAIALKSKETELHELMAATINHHINVMNQIYHINSILLHQTAPKPCEHLTSSEKSQGVGVL